MHECMECCSLDHEGTAESSARGSRPARVVVRYDRGDTDMPPFNDYEHLREALNPELAGLPAEHLEAVLESHAIDAEAMEGWLSTLGSIGKAVLPAVGGIAGTLIGGPAGAAIGSKLGSLAGGALGGLTGSPHPPAPAPGFAPQPAAMGSSPAAGQLLQTMTRPETLQALMSMFLGPQLGRQNVSVGATPVPVGAFSNLLGVLANQAASEYSDAISTVRRRGIPEYMEGFAGEARGDPAVAQDRAGALYELLQVHPAEQDAWGYARQWHESEQADSEYDAMDMADISRFSEQE